jgi:hypothetical protein
MQDPNQPEMTADQEEELDERLQRLAESILTKRAEAIEARAASGIERKWREAQRAFDGLDSTSGKTDMLDFATGEASIGKPGEQQRRSRVIVNIIRGKCQTAEGRFSEIQLPSDDRNWGLLTTRVAESSIRQGGLIQSPMMAQAMPGMPPMDQSAEQIDPLQAKKDDLEKRRAAMEEEIDDQLSECEFNGESRKVIRSAVRLGTGVLKGPSVVKTVRRAWIEQSDETGSAYVMQSVENLKPASKWVDVWNIYPDANCGGDAKRGAYIWERDHVLPREVKALIGVPGYDKRQLMKVLGEPPVRTVVQLEKGRDKQRAVSAQIDRGAPYERWEYHGDIEREDLEAMGCECNEEDGEILSACVVFINDRPVKAVRNMLDTGDLPYDFFQWVPVEDSPWGMSEPHKIIWQQRIITAAWRAMMDNAADSSGAMVVMGKDVEPEDGIWELTGKKIWIDESDDGDVGKAFAQFQITNNQAELQNIIELALRFTDLESGTPAIAQGEQGGAPQILGAMELLMQGADTSRRAQVKQYDDQITRPHVGRYYHWNMQYNKKQEIKGDFEVDARGTSVLLTKDQTAQSLFQIFQMRSDPEIELQVDWGKAIRQLFQARHLDVLKSAEQVEIDRKKRESQPPPEDPRIVAAKIMAEGAGQREQMKSELAQLRLQVERQDKAADREIEVLLKEMEQSGKQTVSLNEIRAMLADTSIKIRAQKELSLATMTQPPTEPAGRAPAGQSFQR